MAPHIFYFVLRVLYLYTSASTMPLYYRILSNMVLPPSSESTSIIFAVPDSVPQNPNNVFTRMALPTYQTLRVIVHRRNRRALCTLVNHLIDPTTTKSVQVMKTHSMARPRSRLNMLKFRGSSFHYSRGMWRFHNCRRQPCCRSLSVKPCAVVLHLQQH